MNAAETRGRPLPVGATILASLRMAIATATEIPVPLLVCASVAICAATVERLFQRAMTGTAQSPIGQTELFSFLWSVTAEWLVEMLVVRNAIAGRNGSALWQIDGRALAVLGLTWGEVLITAAPVYAIVSVLHSSTGVGLASVVLSFCILGVVVIVLIVTTLISALLVPALYLGDKAIGPAAAWRGVAGNRLRLFLLWTVAVIVETAVPLPVSLMLGQTESPWGTALQVVNEGVGFTVASLLGGAFYASVYRFLQPDAVGISSRPTVDFRPR